MTIVCDNEITKKKRIRTTNSDQSTNNSNENVETSMLRGSEDQKRK